MKAKIHTCLVAIALVTAAQAGTPSPTQSPEIQGSGLWQWFVGGSIGHLTDLDHGMYDFQLGMEYRNPVDRTSQAVFLQVGYTHYDVDFQYPQIPPYIPGGPIPPIPAGAPTGSASIDLQIIPITVNYKYEAPITGNLNYYVGLGLGCAVINYTDDWSWYQPTAPPFPHGSGRDEQTDIRPYGELFGGFSYNVSDSFQVFSGMRFICMNNVDYSIPVPGSSRYNVGINHDFLFELGAHYRF